VEDAFSVSNTSLTVRPWDWEISRGYSHLCNHPWFAWCVILGILEDGLILRILVYIVKVWKILASPEQIGNSLPVVCLQLRESAIERNDVLAWIRCLGMIILRHNVPVELYGS
jgi:hypothetical protein